MAGPPPGEGSGAPPSVRILLTPGQRERVKALTGRDFEVLELGDPRGTLAAKLPGMKPPEVELLAIRKARRLNTADEAQHAWLVELARAQDEDAERAARAARVEDEIAKDIKREQKRVEAEFTLLAAGKALPKKGAKGAAGKAQPKKGAKGAAGKAQPKKEAAGAAGKAKPTPDEAAAGAPARPARKAPAKKRAGGARRAKPKPAE